MGDEAAEWEYVDKFYDFWFTFKSWRVFPHEDEEDVEQAEFREQRRWIERFVRVWGRLDSCIVVYNCVQLCKSGKGKGVEMDFGGMEALGCSCVCVVHVGDDFLTCYVVCFARSVASG